MTGVAALTLFLAVRDARPNALDLAAEQLLNRALDFRLVRIRRDVEHDGPAVFAQNRSLLGNERSADDVGEFHANTSWSFSRAPRVATTFAAFITLRALTFALATNSTPAMFLTD